jgi:predicted ABC-type ATPase
MSVRIHHMTKHLYIIAGCNGAGKTTASRTILPKSLLVKEFVNADEIAKGLSPFNPEGVAIEAGRLMLERIKYLLSRGESFSIETTLATRSYVKLVRDASKLGYMVHLVYFWLNSPQLAVERVAERVSEGGHNIPYDVILRRYSKGVDNLFKLFMDEVDIWVIYDNSQYQRERIAFGGKSIETKVNDNDKFKIIKGYVK